MAESESNISLACGGIAESSLVYLVEWVCSVSDDDGDDDEGDCEDDDFDHVDKNEGVFFLIRYADSEENDSEILTEHKAIFGHEDSVALYICLFSCFKL